MSNGRGDLGFIPNQRAPNFSIGFTGGPTNLSKKGFQMPAGAAARVAPEQQRKVAVAPRVPTSDTMIGKRTEWLEARERRLNGLLEQHGDALKTTQSENLERFHELFESTQWVYGWTSRELRGIRTAGSDGCAALGEATAALDTLVEAGAWALLQYPMRHVSQADGGARVAMKIRLVDAKTGQLSTGWAVVGERPANATDVVMSVEEFAVAPRAR